MANFPTGTSKTDLVQNDKVILTDSEDSDRVKDVNVGDSFIIRTSSANSSTPTSGNYVAQSEFNSITDEAFASWIMGAGQINRPNHIGKDSDGSLSGGNNAHTDTYEGLGVDTVEFTTVASTDIAPGGTFWFVANSLIFDDGDNIGIRQDDDSIHWTTVNGQPSNAAVLQVDTGPTVTCSVGNDIFTGVTKAAHSSIGASYDCLNNQQATHLMAPHAFAPASPDTGHNGIFAGSWGKIDGEYNAHIGGGGGSSVQNETTPSALKSVIIGGQSHTMAGTHSVILGGTENTLSKGHGYSIIAGRDGVSPFSYSQTYSMPGFAAGNGSCQNVRFMLQDSNTSTSSVYMQVNGSNLVYRDIPFNVGGGIGIGMTGKIMVQGICVAGTDVGKMARYEQDVSLYITGTQGATSGWTCRWEDSSTSDTGPLMTRTDTGGNQLPMTTAPALQCHSTGIFRMPYTQNTSDLCHWTASFDVNMTMWST